MEGLQHLLDALRGLNVIDTSREQLLAHLVAIGKTNLLPEIALGNISEDRAVAEIERQLRRIIQLDAERAARLKKKRREFGRALLRKFRPCGLRWRGRPSRLICLRDEEPEAQPW